MTDTIDAGADEAKVSADAIAEARCAKCAEALTGRFCAHCGQAARDLRRPLLSLVKEAVEDVAGLDTRLARTLRPLLFRPGHVTREYLSGRRVGLVPPLQWALCLWLVAYLPMALRATYRGSWLMTALKVVGLGVLYLIGFVSIGFTFILFLAVITF